MEHGWTSEKLNDAHGFAAQCGGFDRPLWRALAPHHYPDHAVVINTAKSRRDSTAVQSRQSLAGGSIVAV
jgi:hypothetical protein